MRGWVAGLLLVTATATHASSVRTSDLDLFSMSFLGCVTGSSGFEGAKLASAGKRLGEWRQRIGASLERKYGAAAIEQSYSNYNEMCHGIYYTSAQSTEEQWHDISRARHALKELERRLLGEGI